MPTMNAAARKYIMKPPPSQMSANVMSGVSTPGSCSRAREKIELKVTLQGNGNGCGTSGHTGR
jgi:hypothetical protein